ncbi:sigma-70 domain-containing protein [Lacrimispora sp. 38-1]|uniref:sigma-70 domain-containing protein n=1 Tax=Lacrimispora sp. 38-1 TaxID=3125778 RepID=UPI003CEFC114
MHDNFYQMYLDEMGEITPCTGEEQLKLIADFRGGNQDAKKRLVEGNLRVALEYAKEYDGKGVLLSDLVQEANMALLMAVEEYAKAGGETGFDSYVGQKIKKALELAVEEELSADRTGEELAARVNVLSQISQTLAAELGREATVEELADKMKMSVDEIQGIMKMAMDAVSLNAENADLESLAEVSDLEITESDEEDYDYEV